MAGWRISAFCHETEVDQGGGVGEEVTADQVGSPEREMEVTVHPREMADLQMREPGRVHYVSEQGRPVLGVLDGYPKEKSKGLRRKTVCARGC